MKEFTEEDEALAHGLSLKMQDILIGIPGNVGIMALLIQAVVISKGAFKDHGIDPELAVTKQSIYSVITRMLVTAVEGTIVKGDLRTDS